MTTPKDLSGTWSVAAFHRAIAPIERLADDENFVPTLTRCGALPEGWPEPAARQLALALLRATPGDPDAFDTDAQGRILFATDDFLAWQQALGTGGAAPMPGALRPLFEELTERRYPSRRDRRGLEPTGAFVTRLRQEGAAVIRSWEAAARRKAGLKFENVALLEQAHRDEAEARAMEETGDST